MIVEKDMVVTVTYTLSVDGQEVESANERDPLIFLAGHNTMIPGFESQLLGKTVGDEYAIEVVPSEGYGEQEPEAILEVPRDVFKVEGE